MEDNDRSRPTLRERYRALGRGGKIAVWIVGVFVTLVFIRGLLPAADEEIRAETNDLKSENRALKAERDELQAERDELKAERDGNPDTERIEELVAERDELRDEAAKLKRENERLEGSLENANAERDELRSERDEVEEAASEVAAEEASGDALGEPLFVAYVRSNTTSFDNYSDEELINIGRGSCELITQTQPETHDDFAIELATYLLSEGVDITAMTDDEVSDVATLSGAAIPTLCPEHDYLVE